LQIRLDGKRAIVTGAGRGIGRAIAQSLHDAGARVGLIALEASELASASAAMGNAPWQAADLTDPDALRGAWTDLSAELGAPDVLVHSAGFFDFGRTPEFGRDRWDRLLSVHLDAAFELSRLALPAMSQAGWGRLVIVSSISGRAGETYAAGYSAAKAGLVGLAQSLAKEFARQGITVNAICPGWVDTQLAQAQLTDPEYLALTEQNAEDAMVWALSEIPQGRFVDPSEVGALAAFLASPLAASITGQAIHIDGGMSIRA
jgi:NAD(P)-dependent dehydrogenase (short-subunit alcohol dehydrogenase family)